MHAIGEVATHEPLTYGPSQSKLGASLEPIVGAVADLLKEQPRLRLSVEGHTCKGEPAALGVARAEGLCAALKAKGIPAARTVAHGFGDMLPVGDADDQAARARNRRVQLLLIPDVA